MILNASRAPRLVAIASFILFRMTLGDRPWILLLLSVRNERKPRSSALDPIQVLNELGCLLTRMLDGPN